VVDASGKVVTPGLIDIHTHVAGGLRRLTGEDQALPPDLAGVNAGVTTVVDAGSMGAYNIAGFLNHNAAGAKTRVLALVNAGTLGVIRAPEVRDAADIDHAAAVAAIRARPDVIKGVKARMVSPAVVEMGVELPKAAKAISSEAGVLLMTHIGDILKDHPKAAQVTPRLLGEILTKGDIVTHSFSPRVGALLADRKLLPEVKEARRKGVVFDVGVGTANFSFDSARAVLDQGLRPDTLSSDLIVRSRMNGPTFSLTECMGKVMSVGFSLEDVVRMTTSAAAQAMGIADVAGSLEVGRSADISVLDVVSGDWVFIDNFGGRNRGDLAVRPLACVRAGEVMPLDYGPRPWGWLPESAS
jgi:dihydroorotase